MTTEQQIKKAIQEITGENCELCGNPLKVYVSHRERGGILPLYLSIRVSCPFCEAAVDEHTGIDDMENYDELNHLETGSTLHGAPAMTEI